MMGRVVALATGVAAAVGAAGAAIWAKRRAREAPAPPQQRRLSGGKRRAWQGGWRGGSRRKATLAPAATVETRVPQPTPPETPTRPTEQGALQSLKGIGAVSEERLRALGVTSLAQIAAWTDDDVESIGAQIRVSPERIRREGWVAQARAATER